MACAEGSLCQHDTDVLVDSLEKHEVKHVFPSRRTIGPEMPKSSQSQRTRLCPEVDKPEAPFAFGTKDSAASYQILFACPKERPDRFVQSGRNPTWYAKKLDTSAKFETGQWH